MQDLLQVDRLRQSVAVREALGGREGRGLRKTLSVPNMRQVLGGSLSLDSLVAGVARDQEEEEGRAPRRLPLSLTMSTLHEERARQPHQELESIREQEVPPPLPKSCTSDSLSSPPAPKDGSPSMMSSGYQSQAVSSSTLSSEDSLSLGEEEAVVRRAGAEDREAVVRRAGARRPDRQAAHRLSCPPETLRRPQ